jgi:hypothetical protein
MRSFEIMKRWVEELKENGPKDIGIALSYGSFGRGWQQD